MTDRKKRAGTKKKTKSLKSSARHGQKVRVLLASLFLLGFVGLCLVLLVSLRSNFQPEKPTVVSPPIEVRPPVQPVYGYQHIYALLNAELLSGSQSQGWQKLPGEEKHQRLKMFGDFPDQSRLLELSSKLDQTGAPSKLELLPKKGLVRLYWQGDLRLELRYRLPLKAPIDNRPRIAIVMDDMGRSLTTFQRLLAIDLMVTPAILPESHQATASALFLQDAGREYMIHIPMQPVNFPRANPGANALLLGQSAQQTRKLVRRYMTKVPGAVGGNNHMGSSYTQDRQAMRVVLDELQQSGFFFIDSKTIAGSVAYDEAQRLGVPTAARNIFLDNEEDVVYIRKQIRKMVRMARTRGELIAICHPYAETLQAFREELSWLQQQNIDFVPASALVKMVKTY